MSSDASGPLSPRGLFAWTAATALIVGLAALGLVHRLAELAEKPALREAALSRGLVDPEVTGSIGSAARSITLDPCTGRERLLVRGP